MTSEDSRETAARPDRAAYAIAVLLLIVAALVAWDAAHLSRRVVSYSQVGASAFPYAIAALLVAAALGTARAAWKGEFPDRDPLELDRVGWILAGLIGQIVLVGLVGFSIATGFLFAFAARGFGGKPLWLTFPIGVVFSFILYVIFSKGLQLSLPAGPLERLV